MNDKTKTLISKIRQVKKEKGLMIIAHLYQPVEVQALADFVGDSLAMAKAGKASSKETLLICGVRFMAESAKMLSPEKTVLMPTSQAGCPMADTVDRHALKAYKKDHPHRYIVSYVNTSAAVKAESDICVTSSNALSIVKKINEDHLLFLPDQNLGSYIKDQVPEKDLDLWPGFCPSHHRLRREALLKVKRAHPQAKVLAHPECRKEILDEADYIGSTSGIIQFASDSLDKQFIIATEEGVLYPLQQANPDKVFIMASQGFICKNMKKVTLKGIYNSLVTKQTPLVLPERIIKKGMRPLEKMLELS